MKAKMKLWTLGASVAVALATSSASAATICVIPVVYPSRPSVGRASCQTTIQGAVNTAAAGDTITIAIGTYYENVDVPPGKDGLKILGASKTGAILDPSAYAELGITNTGAGLTIHSRNVQVRNLAIRNGQTFGVVVLGAGALIQGLSLRGQNAGGISVAATAYGAQILLNEVRSGNTGIVTAAYGTIIKGNVVGEMVSAGIYALAGANNVQIVGNRIANVGFGIFAEGNSVITSNDVTTVEVFGIGATGTAPSIQRNRVQSVQGEAGIGVLCGASCIGGTVAFNSVTDVAGFGILAVSDAPGLSIESNVVLRTGFDGVSTNGPGIFTTQNRVTDAGITTDVPCFSTHGDANVVSRNTVTKCAAAGFYVNGADNYLDQNLSTSAYENGFTVDGDDGSGGFFAGVTLFKNKATTNAAQGIAVINGAASTNLSGNVAGKNRLDFCDDGTTTVNGSGNVFGTSAATSGTDCPIVHVGP